MQSSRSSPLIIAIDGPAGAGKSTVARGVAQRLGLPFLDTGAMYRAIALLVLRHGADPDSEQACRRIADAHRLSFDASGRVLIDGESGEPAIRGREVTAIVSQVSAHAGVREAVVREQRAIAERTTGLVAEGRDTTTVVFPRATHKFFLIASPQARATRRAEELGRPDEVASIRADIERRDRLDSTRLHSPLMRANDAVVIDTERLEPDEVVESVLRHVREPKRS